MQYDILKHSPWISQGPSGSPELLEVLAASLPFFFEDEEADEWLHVFEKAVSGIGPATVDTEWWWVVGDSGLFAVIQ